MSTNQVVSYVESIIDLEINIICRDEVAAGNVKSLGGKRALLSSRKWKLLCRSKDELAFQLSSLRDARIAMAGASAGWPPSAVFEKLRDEGKVAGEFFEIIWCKPGEELVLEK